MPQTLTFPFQAFKLHLKGGDTITFPLSDANALHLKKPVAELARKYSDRFQKKLLDKGTYLNILNEVREGEFHKKSIKVPFPAAKDGISYPKFELEFDYYSQQKEDHLWGLIPALGLESMAMDEAALEERLVEVVKVDFTARKRLTAVQLIIGAMWFEATEGALSQTSFTFYTPSELLDLQKEKKKEWLPKTAARLTVKEPVAYGRETELEHMGRIMASSFSKSILLVGPNGCGKTALIWELARRRQQLKMKTDIWETTASVLIKELTVDTGWQDNLSHLVGELTAKGDFLYIRNLADLFEVGQYEGNEISIGAYLRPYLSRGELNLLTECTKEERARIELLHPNYLSFFQIIEVVEPKEGLEDIIQQKVRDLAGRKKVTFEKDSIEEVIRLNRRFSPYSGMPGKPIRFLESLLLGQVAIIPNSNKKKTKKARKKAALEFSAKKEQVISRQSVLHAFSEESGMPPFMIDPDLPMDVEAIKRGFNENVFGQEHAVHTVVDMPGSRQNSTHPYRQAHCLFSFCRSDRSG